MEVREEVKRPRRAEAQDRDHGRPIGRKDEDKHKTVPQNGISLGMD